MSQSLLGRQRYTLMICENVTRGSLCIQDNPCVFMSLTMGQVLGHSSTKRFLCIAALVWYVYPITGASLLPQFYTLVKRMYCSKICCFTKWVMDCSQLQASGRGMMTWMHNHGCLPSSMALTTGMLCVNIVPFLQLQNKLIMCTRMRGLVSSLGGLQAEM